MTLEEANALKAEYFDKEGYVFPGDFEHRVDPYSSGLLYSFIRREKPKSVLGIGTWFGGSTCVMMAALVKNEVPFTYHASEIAPDKLIATSFNCTRVNGISPMMLPDITISLKHVPKVLDCLYVDTDHDEDTTVWIVENIIPRVKKGGIISFHDWAVEERPDGRLVGKGHDGVGGWPETNYIMNLIREGKFPAEKIFWTYGVSGTQETAFWRKI